MKDLQDNWTVSETLTSVTPERSVQYGLLAGLAGVIAMDLVMMGGLAGLGLPTDTCFMTIGKTAAHFFSLFGMRLAGDVIPGVAVFHLLGPLLGAIYGLIISHINALQRTTLKKSLFYAVLYAELVSQLILTTAPILLRMPAQETILWFAGSFVLHAIWGAVMGLVTYHLLRMRIQKTNILRFGGISWKIKWLARKTV